MKVMIGMIGISVTIGISGISVTSGYSVKPRIISVLLIIRNKPYKRRREFNF
jgi:hypothetical protein